MKRKHIIILVLLLTLTILSAFFASFFQYGLLILGLSAIKFLLVAFQFMELKKAHRFWKIALVLIVVLIMLLISILK